jgi:DNA invertase Pin-like site-specific DNA recombinase
MRVKYNRTSTLQQTGDRFSLDKEKYDLTILERVSGTVPFKDRPKVKEKLLPLISSGKLTELITEEYSRLGRSMGDVIQTLEWLDGLGINVTVRNIGLQSRPNGKRNPIWKMISSVMSSLYEMELENIKERTATGRMVYLQKGGKLGRPAGSTESEKDFISKESSKLIKKYIDKGLSIREVSRITKSSTKTVLKVKKLLLKINRG